MCIRGMSCCLALRIAAEVGKQTKQGTGTSSDQRITDPLFSSLFSCSQLCNHWRRSYRRVAMVEPERERHEMRTAGFSPSLFLVLVRHLSTWLVPSLVRLGFPFPFYCSRRIHRLFTCFAPSHFCRLLFVIIISCSLLFTLLHIINYTLDMHNGPFLFCPNSPCPSYDDLITTLLHPKRRLLRHAHDCTIILEMRSTSLCHTCPFLGHRFSRLRLRYCSRHYGRCRPVRIRHRRNRISGVQAWPTPRLLRLNLSPISSLRSTFFLRSRVDPSPHSV